MSRMPTVLERILAEKRKEIEDRKAAVSLSDLLREVASAPPPMDFAAALTRCAGDPVRLIAEFKRASPSKGMIRGDLDPAAVARLYEEAGAAAMSVLTDGPFFSGTLADLRAARAAAGMPLLRKDFILDVYQLAEARAAGADAILLIAAALSDEVLADLQRHAADLGLAALVEVHNDEELRRVLGTGAELVGINNRDLQTYEVDLDTTLRLRPQIPADVVVVAESGIHSRADVRNLEDAGADAVLVGEFLMRQPDPGKAVRQLLGR